MMRLLSAAVVVIALGAACSSQDKAAPASTASAPAVAGVDVELGCLAEEGALVVPMAAADVCDGQIRLSYGNATHETAYLRVGRRDLDGSVVVSASIPLPPADKGAPLAPELLDKAVAVHALYIAVAAAPIEASDVNGGITKGTIPARYERPAPYQ